MYKIGPSFHGGRNGGLKSCSRSPFSHRLEYRMREQTTKTARNQKMLSASTREIPSLLKFVPYKRASLGALDIAGL